MYSISININLKSTRSFEVQTRKAKKQHLEFLPACVGSSTFVPPSDLPENNSHILLYQPKACTVNGDSGMSMEVIVTIVRKLVYNSCKSGK